jgi:CHAT domain-containing protein
VTHGDPFASLLCFRDGNIEAMSLAELPLRAELVVMSACHSGQRALNLPWLAELPGDDLFGLQAAFFQAGARSVIGALWPLDDESALAILPSMHERLSRDARPEDALREAVREFIAAPPEDKQGIYYWAPLFMSSIGRVSSEQKEVPA